MPSTVEGWKHRSPDVKHGASLSPAGRLVVGVLRVTPFGLRNQYPAQAANRNTYQFEYSGWRHQRCSGMGFQGLYCTHGVLSRICEHWSLYRYMAPRYLKGSYSSDINDSFSLTSILAIYIRKDIKDTRDVANFRWAPQSCHTPNIH